MQNSECSSPIFSKLLSIKQESGQLIRKHTNFPQQGISVKCELQNVKC